MSRRVRQISRDTLTAIADEFDLSLEAARKSPKTRHNYRDAVRQLAAFLGDPEVGAVRRSDIERFLVQLEATGRSPSTVATRYRGLQQFWRYVSEEFELPNPMAKMKPPALPERITPVVSERDLRALLKTCSGRNFEAMRDTAVVRLLLDSGIRLGELTGLRVVDIDLKTKDALVVGKGDRTRLVPFETKTALALRKYLRVRASHDRADAPALWLGRRGPLTDSGLARVLRQRADDAGFKLHPHQLRHTYAHMFLASGGRESDLMRLAGWRSPDMVRRYGAAVADERARDSYRQHSPGERI